MWRVAWDATYAWEAREAHSLRIYADYAATGTPAVGCGGAAFGVVAAASLDASFLNIYSTKTVPFKISMIL